MGRKPLSSFSPEELRNRQMAKEKEKVDDMFNGYSSNDIEDIEKFLIRVEGTSIFWYTLSKLINQNIQLKEEQEKLSNLSSRVKEIEEAMESLSNFRKRNEYGF